MPPGPAAPTLRPPGLPQRSEKPRPQRIRCLPAARESPRGGQGLALSVQWGLGRQGRGSGRGGRCRRPPREPGLTLLSRPRHACSGDGPARPPHPPALLPASSSPPEPGQPLPPPPTASPAALHPGGSPRAPGAAAGAFPVRAVRSRLPTATQLFPPRAPLLPLSSFPPPSPARARSRAPSRGPCALCPRSSESCVEPGRALDQH